MTVFGARLYEQCVFISAPLRMSLRCFVSECVFSLSQITVYGNTVSFQTPLFFVFGIQRHSFVLK